MIIVAGKRGVLEDYLVFFPDEQEAARIVRRMSAAAIVSVVQTQGALDDLPGLRQRSSFRTTWLDLTRSLEEIESAMDRKSCRYEIRRAAKFGERIEVSRDTGSEEKNKFFELYNSFVR